MELDTYILLRPWFVVSGSIRMCYQVDKSRDGYKLQTPLSLSHIRHGENTVDKEY